MPKDEDRVAAVVAKVRAHYSLEQQQQRKEGSIRRSWDDDEEVVVVAAERKGRHSSSCEEDRLTRAISDALFVYPFYRMLKTAADTGLVINNGPVFYKRI